MANAPNRRPVWRRILTGLLVFPLLIGLGIASFADPAIWSLVGWVVLALVITRILVTYAPAHAGWPLALTALGFLATTWQAPWQAVTAGWPLPWILLVVFGEIAFVAWVVAGLRYSQLCSQLGQPATWKGYRFYVSTEVPRFAKNLIRTLSKYRIERVK